MTEPSPGESRGEPKFVDVRRLDQTVHAALSEAHKALARGENEQAQAAYRRALAAAPDDPTVPYVMAGLLRQSGQPMPALSLSLKAWRMAPQDPSARLALAAGFRGARFQQASPAVVQALLALFVAPDVSAQELTNPSLSLMRANQTMTELLACKGDAAALAAFLAEEEQRKAVETLFADPLARALLGRALVPDAEFERLFTCLRRVLLDRVLEGKPLPLSAGSVASLALQADMGSYAWPVAAEEQAAVEALTPGKDWDAARLVRALYRRPDPGEPLPEEPLSGGPDSGPLTLLHLRHHVEPAHEARLASTIPRLAGQDSPAAEPPPFPRWRSISRQPGRPLPQILAESLPLLPPGNWPEVAQPQVLVAGCGTGGTAVRAASRYANAQVLALDRSLAALCYARRQAEAIGCTTISFALASLEALAGPEVPALPGGPFDVIECPSWLQFTDDPAAGLAALAGLAGPQGFLRLGFYRQSAQQALLAARDSLTGGRSPESEEALRQTRQELLDLPEGDPARAVVQGLDFYDLAGLSGLLSQADARAFSLAQVKALLEAAGLSFLGFELPDRRIYAAFRQRHPDPAASQDLGLWEAFESEQPQIFLQAYQLWARPTASNA